MNALQLLQDAIAAGVEVWTEGDRIQVKNVSKAPHLVAQMKACKQELLQLIEGSPPSSPPPAPKVPTPAEILELAAAAGVKVRLVDGERLGVTGADRDARVAALLREHKPAIVALLQRRADPVVGTMCGGPQGCTPVHQSEMDAATLDPAKTVAVVHPESDDYFTCTPAEAAELAGTGDGALCSFFHYATAADAAEALAQLQRGESPRLPELPPDVPLDAMKVTCGPAGCEVTPLEPPAPMVASTHDALTYFTGPELYWMAGNPDDVTSRQMARLYQLAQQGGDYERQYLRKAVAEWRRAPYHLQRMTPANRLEGDDHGPGEDGAAAAGAGSGDEEGAGERGEAPGPAAAPAIEEAAAGPEPAAPDRAAGASHADEPQDPGAPGPGPGCVGCGAGTPMLLIRHNYSNVTFNLDRWPGADFLITAAAEHAAEALRLSFREAELLCLAALGKAKKAEDQQSGWWCVPCLKDDPYVPAGMGKVLAFPCARGSKMDGPAPACGHCAQPRSDLVRQHDGSHRCPTCPQLQPEAEPDPALKSAIGEMLQAFPKGEGVGEEAPLEFVRTKRRQRCDQCNLLHLENATVNGRKICRLCAADPSRRPIDADEARAQ